VIDHAGQAARTPAVLVLWIGGIGYLSGRADAAVLDV